MNTEELTSYPVNSVIALTHVFSPTLLNDFRFGFNRGTATRIYLNPTGALYAIAVAGLTSLNNGRLSTGVGNTFRWLGDVTAVKGRNVIKARNRGPPHTDEPGEQCLWHDQLQLPVGI